METTKEQALDLIIKLLSHKPTCNLNFEDGYNVKICLNVISKAFEELDNLKEKKS